MGALCGTDHVRDSTQPETASQRQISIQQIGIHEVYNVIANGTRDLIFLDLRSSEKYQSDHIADTINIDINAMTKTDENQIGQELGHHVKEEMISAKALYLLYDETESKETIEKTNRLFEMIVIPTIQNISAWCRFTHIYYCACYNEVVEQFGFVLAKENSTVSDTHSEDEKETDKHLEVQILGKRNKKIGYPSCILPARLYLGNARHAKDGDTLKALGITHIVNVTSEVENYFEKDGIQYLKFEIEDNPSLDIAQYFERAIQFIDHALSEEKHRVFVHCQAGISRSASVVIAYIMARHNMPVYEEALAFVRERRPIVYPNRGFVQQLKAYQSSL